MRVGGGLVAGAMRVFERIADAVKLAKVGNTGNKVGNNSGTS